MSATPDPAALRIVLDASRALDASSPDFPARLKQAVLDHPDARGANPTLLAKLAGEFSDASRGFDRPVASFGYVVAGLYTRRGRIALALGLPLLALIGVSLIWYVAERKQREELVARQAQRVVKDLWELRGRRHQLALSSAQLGEDLERKTCDPRYSSQVRVALKKVAESLSSSGNALESVREVELLDALRLRRARAQCQEADSNLEEGEAQLETAKTAWATGQHLLSLRNALENLRRESLILETNAETLRLYDDGVRAFEAEQVGLLESDVDRLREQIRVRREAATLPAKLDAALDRIVKRTDRTDIQARASAWHRQGIQGLSQPNGGTNATAVLKELDELADRLDEEYTVVITGGKWRFRNDNPSVKTYYVLVEAQDAQGRKLQRSIHNEESGRTERVSVWGERVPFEIYERVRRDKQDDGVIDRKVFAAKKRGVLDEEMLYPTEDGAGVVPKVGQITRW